MLCALERGSSVESEGNFRRGFEGLTHDHRLCGSETTPMLDLCVVSRLTEERNRRLKELMQCFDLPSVRPPLDTTAPLETRPCPSTPSVTTPHLPASSFFDGLSVCASARNLLQVSTSNEVGGLKLAPLATSPKVKGGKVVRSKRKARPKTCLRSKPVESDVLREEEFWFLDNDQVEPCRDRAMLQKRVEKQVGRRGYSACVVDALKKNVHAREAFADKVSRVVKERRQQKKEEAAMEGVQGVRRPYSALSVVHAPPTPLTQMQRLGKIHTAAAKARVHRQRTFVLSQQRETIHHLHRTANSAADRLLRTRDVQLCFTLVLSFRMNRIFATHLQHYRKTGATPPPFKNKHQRYTTAEWKAINANIGEKQTIEESERTKQESHAAHLSRVAKQAIEKVSRHQWIFALYARVRAKQRSVYLIRLFLETETTKARITNLVKRLRYSATRLQRWWRHMRVVLHCCDTVLGQQWDAINSRICEWDVPSIATFEEETGLSFDDAGITVTAVPRKPDPKKKGNPADREREAAMEAEAFMRSDAALDVRCALQTMKAVQTQAIHFVVTEDIKRRLITLVRRRMDAFFSIKFKKWQNEMLIAEREHQQYQAIRSAKIHLDSCTTYDSDEDNFDWPVKPARMALLHPNEVRLCILYGYKVYMSAADERVAQDTGMAARSKVALSQMLSEEEVFSGLREIQQSMDFPDVTPFVFCEPECI